LPGRKDAEAPGALDMEWGSLLLVGSFLVDMFIPFCCEVYCGSKREVKILRDGKNKVDVRDFSAL
jgi:hypothetical protein